MSDQHNTRPTAPTPSRTAAPPKTPPKAPLTAQAIQRRYLILTATLWLPVGVTAPTLVLLLQSRGIDLPTVGVLFAIYSGLVILLAIPSGSFADVVGRQGTMMLAGVVRILGLVALALGQSFLHLAGGLVLFAISRALQSGPLEAWYVDSTHVAAPGAPVQRGIARGWAAEATALAVGAVTGGFLPRIFAGLAADAVVNSFSVPFLISALLGLLGLVAFGTLMPEPPRSAAPGLQSALTSIPGTLVDGVRLATRDRYLRLLLVSMLAMGFAIAALEVMAPMQFAEQLGDATQASAAYGVLVTLAFFGTAGGSLSAPRAAALLGSASRAAALSTGAVAVALLGLALGPTFAVAAAAYVLVYLIAGVPGPLKNDIAHSRVRAGGRATLLSVNSLAQQVGVLLGSLAVPALASGMGFRYGWGLAAVVVLAGAGVLLLLPRDVPAIDAHGAPAGALGETTGTTGGGNLPSGHVATGAETAGPRDDDGPSHRGAGRLLEPNRPARQGN